MMRITGSRKDLLAFKEFARGTGPKWDGEPEKEAKNLDLNKFVPVPDEVLFAKKNNRSDAFNSGGYEWCVTNWGTKWGCYDLEVTEPRTKELVYMFLTAWSPFGPGVLEAMSSRFPTLKFELKYAEGGMGFCGIMTAEDGLVDDNYYEGESTDKVAKRDADIAQLLGTSG